MRFHIVIIHSPYCNFDRTRDYRRNAYILFVIGLDSHFHARAPKANSRSDWHECHESVQSERRYFALVALIGRLMYDWKRWFEVQFYNSARLRIEGTFAPGDRAICQVGSRAPRADRPAQRSRTSQLATDLQAGRTRKSAAAFSVPVFGRAFSRSDRVPGRVSVAEVRVPRPPIRNGECHRRRHHPRDVAPTISCHGARRRDYLTHGNDSRLVGGIVSRLA